MPAGETMLSRLTGTLKNFFGIGPKSTRATLSASGLTAARTFTLPDVTGTVVVANGTAVGQILYWNGSAWTVLAPPSSGNGWALRWDNTNGRPSWTVPTYSRSVLGTSFIGSGASTAFQATGLSVTIPATGHYEIEGSFRILMSDTAAGYFAVVRLALNGTPINNTELFGAYSSAAGGFMYDTISQTYRASFTAGDVISVQYAAVYTGTPSTIRGMYSDATGRSSLSYIAL